ncbi:terminase large subunit [Poseidoniales virus YSH_150918]|uniref:Terminase large subunit n=1 Tax=Poseidoniales virus YSH_150918 TaxID=3071324 RepID=A0A976UB01_9CAUD|nr:terminase large subunit [Yangshan Harbor Poseidoniales virus]UVF62580.1 terminase large subunit [Poseidoniales virus YSH_150918]
MDIESLNFEHQMDMELSKNSFPYFFQNVLGFQFTHYMEEWYDLLNKTNRNVIVCSRGHGKSVFMHCWAVWNLIFQPPPYQMLYISSNQKQTMVHMRDIDKLFAHPMLAKFKPVRGWAIGNITLTNGNQILERSVGSQIRGLHPQEIIIDDPLKEFSVSGIQKVTDWFYGDMIPTLHHTASLRVIGTPFSYTDIYQQLAENEAYTVRTYPCLNALNEPLWKERWDYDALMERKAEIGSLKFTREYMCVPISTGTSLFNPEYLEHAKNKDLILKPYKREGYKYYVGIDPAISTDGDYNVITVLEVDENDNKSVVYIDRAKNVEFRENIQKMKIIGKVFQPEVVLFETNTFAKSFTQELRNVTDLNVHDFNTTRKKKEEIILNLQMNFENGKIHLPYGNEESRRVSTTMIEELSMFAITERGKFEGVGAHDDMVMSLALANAATKTISESFVLLDDMGLFDYTPTKRNRGITGLNL